MDWTALGALLAGVGTLAGAFVAWAGKRGENKINHSGTAITGYSSLTEDLWKERLALKEELSGKREELLNRTTALAQEAAARASAEAEVIRLRDLVKRLGGDPS